MDRIDLQVEVPRVDYTELEQKSLPENSAKVKQRVQSAREIQQKRFKNERINSNAEMSTRQLQNYCILKDEALQLAKTSFQRLGLSLRAYDRILKVARTAADLEGYEIICPHHLAEAIQYRNLDRLFEGGIN